MQALSFHPTGDYLLVGTKQPVVRVYDVNTSQCFVTNHLDGSHKGEILSLAYVNYTKAYLFLEKSI